MARPKRRKRLQFIIPQGVANVMAACRFSDVGCISLTVHVDGPGFRPVYFCTKKPLDDGGDYAVCRFHADFPCGEHDRWPGREAL